MNHAVIRLVLSSFCIVAFLSVALATTPPAAEIERVRSDRVRPNRTPPAKAAPKSTFSLEAKQQHAFQMQKNRSSGHRNPLDQGGEDCSDAIVISALPFCDRGTTVGYQDDQYEFCINGGGSPDVFYLFEPTEDVFATVSLCGSDFATYMDIREVSSDCQYLGGLTCANASCYNGSTYQSCIQNYFFGAGGIYQIVVDGDHDQGNYVLNITTDGQCHNETCGVNPAGEDCASAGEIYVAPNTYSIAAGTTVGADATCTDECIYLSDGPDMFYFFTLTECRRLAIKLESGDSHISIYQGIENCCGTAFLCNDDHGDFQPLPDWDNSAQHPAADFDSYVAAEFPAGTYYIRCGMYDAGEAPFTLTIYDNGACVGPAGEDCANAGLIVVEPNTATSATGTTVGADVTCTDDCIWLSQSPDVFYYFNLTECRRLAIKLESGDSHISIYQGPENCCITPFLCNEDHGDFSPLPPWDNPAQHPAADFDSYVAADFPAGTYYIRCGMFDTGEAPFTLTIYDNGSCTSGDNCANPIVIGALPASIAGSTVGFADDYANCFEGGGAPDVVFSYTPTQDVLADLYTCDQTYFESRLSIVRDGDLDNPTCGAVGCWSWDGFNFYADNQIYCYFFEAGHSYCIILDGNTTGAEGNYVLTIDTTHVEACDGNQYCGFPRETEPNNSCSPSEFDSHIIHCGDTLYGNICGPGDKDYYLAATGEDTSQFVSIVGGPNCDQINPELGLAVALYDGDFHCYEFDPCNFCSWTVGACGPETLVVVVEGMGACKAGPYRLTSTFDVHTPQSCDPAICTNAPVIPCDSAITVNTCGGCDILCQYYVDGTWGPTVGAGRQQFYRLNVPTAGNYTIDVATDSTAAWNQNVQYMLFTDCTLPKTSVVFSQDQNNYFTSVDGPRYMETGTVLLTPGTYYLAASISADYPYGASCGDLTVRVTCPCERPADLVVKWLTGTAQSRLNWTATAGQYLVYSTTIPNNDGDPRNSDPQWSLRATLTLPSGPASWTDPGPSGTYRNYAVVKYCP